jgi:hypothetical protein
MLAQLLAPSAIAFWILADARKGGAPTSIRRRHILLSRMAHPRSHLSLLHPRLACFSSLRLARSPLPRRSLLLQWRLLSLGSIPMKRTETTNGGCSEQAPRSRSLLHTTLAQVSLTSSFKTPIAGSESIVFKETFDRIEDARAFIRCTVENPLPVIFAVFRTD